MAEVKREYHNGILVAEWFEINGKYEGEFKIYQDNGYNGYVYEISNYVNGIQQGEYKMYYENGQLCEIGNYVNGKCEGEFKKYHENGQLIRITNYHNGFPVYKSQKNK